MRAALSDASTVPNVAFAVVVLIAVPPVCHTRICTTVFVNNRHTTETLNDVEYTADTELTCERATLVMLVVCNGNKPPGATMLTYRMPVDCAVNDTLAVMTYVPEYKMLIPFAGH